MYRCNSDNKMCAVLLPLSLLVISFSNSCDASRILFVAPTPSYSHQIVFQPIWKELSLRGHQVTVITPNPLKDSKLTNLTEIDISYIYRLIEDKLKFSETLNKLKDDPLKFGKVFVQGLSHVNDVILSDPKVARLIQDPEIKFDVVIAEVILPTMIVFGHRFQCPTIGIISLDGTLIAHDVMGNPTHPVLNPESTLKFTGNLTFLQKVYSVLYSVLRRIVSILLIQGEYQIIARHFGAGYPSLDEMARNIDLFLMNVNPAFHNVRPTVPAVIHIGGSMSIRPQQPLPEDLQQFLDHAEDGVIYFSLGTNVRTALLPENFIDTMIVAFSMLPYQILWKIDEPDMPQKSENVRIVNWIPQQDVLRHPNVKAFITQGGLQSIEESINFKKPIVCIPFFADQFSNCIQAQNKGMGITLDRKNVNVQIVKAAVTEVVENIKYLTAVTKLSEISADQPMTGLEKAVWWAEYVIRHNGAKHLRSPAIDMPLYEYFLLDVLGFLFVVTFVGVYVLWKLIKLIFGSIRRVFWKKGCKNKDKETLKFE